jgi:multiple sugar transport system permease protein
MRRGGRRQRGTVLLLMSPWIVGFLVFYVYPMLATLYYSFTHFDLLTQPKWVGFSNYRFMFTRDPFFWQSVRNTLWIIVVGVPIQIVFALSVAMVLTRPKRGVGIYRTIFFLPSMIPAVAATLGFLFLLNPVGPIDHILHALHIPAPLWFQDPHYAKPGLVVLSVWGIGETMIIMLAGLLDVPAQLYEAADIEGASGWQKFRYVTLPMISPVIFFAIVIGVIQGFQYFTQGFIASSAASSGATLGDPQGSLLFYTIWLYVQGFTASHLGYASAMAWVLFLIILACTVAIFRSSSRWVHYQGALR